MTEGTDIDTQILILAQSYNSFTHGFCGYLSNLSLIVGQSVAIWI